MATTAVRINPAKRSPGAKASEVLAWAKAVERDLANTEAGLREHAQTVYLGIKKSSKMPAGVDKIIVARLMRRRILKAAAAARLGSSAMHQFRTDWYRHLGQPGTKEAVRKHGIDMTQ